MQDKVPLSVSQFLDAINLAIESATEYEIQGEVCEFKKGKWISFSLKDPEDGSLLKCVMGEWTWRRIGIELEDGMQVKIAGNAKVNKKYGSFGMWVDTIEPLGEGSLKKAYELLLAKLRAEGLFERKRAIPNFLQRIGLVSSKHGVVIHDFMNNLSKLGLSITFIDSRVEGDGAVEGLIQAIRTLQDEKYHLDALVVIRGGGSLESMQAFNNEAVVRTLFASRIPTIVGIGHDVDVPIACLVADTSASTPTATAVLVNQTWSPVREGAPRLEQRLLHAYERMLRGNRHALELHTQHLTHSLARIFTTFHAREASVLRLLQSLEARLGTAALYVATAFERLDLLFTQHTSRVSQRLGQLEQYLTAVSPERTLRLGYGIIRNQEGKVVRSVHNLVEQESMTTMVADGTITSTITELKVT